jgi:hypothetical protein
MSKHITYTSDQDELRSHPAFQFWRKLQPRGPDGESISTLKKTWWSTVYRLEGADKDGSAVIAKRSLGEKALVERLVYEKLLAQLPIPGLKYYGFLQDPDSRFSWLFIEEAPGDEYSPRIDDHRVLAGRWLGTMHTLTSAIGSQLGLPDRGPDHYLNHLRTARRRMLANFMNPTLDDEQRTTLRTVVSRLDIVEAHWSRAERWCANMPRVLCHTNFSTRHLRVRTQANGDALLVFDWGSAGWGVPADDLQCFADRARTSCMDPGLAVYWSVAQQTWPNLDIKDIQRWAIQGRFLRSLGWLNWKSGILARDCGEEYLRSRLENFVENADARSATMIDALRDDFSV